jgi:selenocysteine lyase/cysteine desulfurase
LKEAVEFHEAIGRDRVARRTADLATRLKEGLAEFDNVHVVTPTDPSLSAGIVCFEAEGYAPPDVLGILIEAGVVASVTPYSTQYVRLGPSIVTNEAEIDRTLSALRSSL